MTERYSAPGKLILCGEHAVVYGQPAIAMPLAALRATVAVEATAPGDGLTVAAPDLGVTWRLSDRAPLSDLAERALRHLDLAEPDALLTIASVIPIASGMGSGAAVGAALVRALAGMAGRDLPPATVSDLVYESERAFHGTPSGIDNTVVAYEQPIVFQRAPVGAPWIAPLQVGAPWSFVVADSGVASETRAVVGDLRRRWSASPAEYESRFAEVGSIVRRVKLALRGADPARLGALLAANHAVLVELGVSDPALDRLVAAAMDAGAWGAKLSGAGWGGVMLALVPPEAAAAVADALRAAGAPRTWATDLRPPATQEGPASPPPTRESPPDPPAAERA